MFKNCGIIFLYAMSATVGYKAGLNLWDKYTARKNK